MIISVDSFFGDVIDLDHTVAVSDEETGADVVPGNGGDLVILVKLDLLGFGLGLDLVELVVSIGDGRGILGFEVPDFPAEFGSDGNPVALGVEGQTGDGGIDIMSGVRFFDVAEVENSDLKVLATGDQEVTSGGDGDGVDVGIMGLEAVLDVESLVVPDLQVSIPTN